VFLKAHVFLAVATIIAIYQHTTTIASKVVLIVPSATFGLMGVFWIGRIFYRNIAREPQRPETISFSTLNDHRPEASQIAEPQHMTRSRTKYRYCSGSVVTEEKHRLATDSIHLRIKLPRPWKIRAGHYIQLSLPTLGAWSLTQTHPFMIAWWGDNSNGVSVDLLIEKQKGFTSRLLELTDTQLGEFPILLDGPYGHPENFGIYSTVILFVADIEIVSVILYAKELLESS